MNTDISTMIASDTIWLRGLKNYGLKQKLQRHQKLNEPQKKLPMSMNNSWIKMLKIESDSCEILSEKNLTEVNGEMKCSLILEIVK